MRLGGLRVPTIEAPGGTSDPGVRALAWLPEAAAPLD